MPKICYMSGKQCRHWWDAAFYNIWARSTLLVHPCLLMIHRSSYNDMQMEKIRPACTFVCCVCIFELYLYTWGSWLLILLLLQIFACFTRCLSDFFLHTKRVSGYLINSEYHNNFKYRDRQARANSTDPDQMLQNAASDLGLHWLQLIQHYFRTSTGSISYFFFFKF